MMSLISLLRLFLPPDLVQLGHGLLVGGLYLEQLSGVAPTLDLRPVKLSLESVNLLLPFNNDLVKVLGSLLHLHAPGLGVIKLGGRLLDISLELHFVLLQRGRLTVEVLHCSLSLSKP